MARRPGPAVAVVAGAGAAGAVVVVVNEVADGYSETRRRFLQILLGSLPSISSGSKSKSSSYVARDDLRVGSSSSDPLLSVSFDGVLSKSIEPGSVGEEEIDNESESSERT